MEQESRAGCILHGCGVLAALAGLCAASGATCVFALTPGWRVWAVSYTHLVHHPSLRGKRTPPG